MERRQRPTTGYEIVVRKVDSGYFAECPALHGCWSRGLTEEDAAEGSRRLIRAFLAQKDQLLIEGPYQDLADVIVSWYSWDASWWREWGIVSSPAGGAIRVAFRFEGQVPHYGAELLDQIVTRLKVPYTTEEWDRAAAILVASPTEEAEMEVVLSEAMDNGDLCLRHELWSKKTRRQVSVGHFPLLSSAWVDDASAGHTESMQGDQSR